MILSYTLGPNGGHEKDRNCLTSCDHKPAVAVVLGGVNRIEEPTKFGGDVS